VVLDVDLLQTLQGVASGGRDEVAKYWGTAEYTLNVDTQKLGLWPGGFLRVEGLSSFGQNISNTSGTLISPSFVSLLPEPGNTTTGLMNLTFMQFLSPHFGVFLGVGRLRARMGPAIVTISKRRGGARLRQSSGVCERSTMTSCSRRCPTTTMGKENQIVNWAIRSIGTIPKKC
jgi:hypothetical protein